MQVEKEKANIYLQSLIRPIGLKHFLVFVNSLLYRLRMSTHFILIKMPSINSIITAIYILSIIIIIFSSLSKNIETSPDYSFVIRLHENMSQRAPEKKRIRKKKKKRDKAHLIYLLFACSLFDRKTMLVRFKNLLTDLQLW
jgi:hypothetical protein